MTRLITALIIGSIFGAGLAIAGMLNPSKVVGFLDVFGDWDPSLAFVMGGGVLVNAIGHRFVMKRKAPIQCATFSMPTSTNIDKPLVIGSVIFGMGWGLAGLCPGPVVASLLSEWPSDAAVFWSYDCRSSGWPNCDAPSGLV
jgi:uncharacterized membrane protein YedE/YeeE